MASRTHFPSPSGYIYTLYTVFWSAVSFITVLLYWGWRLPYMNTMRCHFHIISVITQENSSLSLVRELAFRLLSHLHEGGLTCWSYNNLLSLWITANSGHRFTSLLYWRKIIVFLFHYTDRRSTALPELSQCMPYASSPQYTTQTHLFFVQIPIACGACDDARDQGLVGLARDSVHVYLLTLI